MVFVVFILLLNAFSSGGQNLRILRVIASCFAQLLLLFYCRVLLSAVCVVSLILVFAGQGSPHLAAFAAAKASGAAPFAQIDRKSKCGVYSLHNCCLISLVLEQTLSLRTAFSSTAKTTRQLCRCVCACARVCGACVMCMSGQHLV